MKRALLPIALLSSLLAVSVARGENQRSPRELREDLARVLRTGDRAEPVTELILALAGDDSSETARSLFQAISVFSRRITDIDKEREVLATWIYERDRDQMFAPVRWALGSRAKAEYDEKRSRFAELGTVHDAAEEGTEAAVEVLSSIKGPNGLRILASGLRDNDNAVKEASIRSLVEASPEELTSRLDRLLVDRSPRIRVAAARAAKSLRSMASLGRLVTMSQDDTSWVARAAAMEALAELRAGEAVMPLIESLDAELGRLRTDAARALAELTGESFGSVPGAWKSWWEAQGRELPASRPVRRKEEPSEPVRYYGVETSSRRVVFVIDASESMGETMSGKPSAGESEPRKKLQAAQSELKKTMSHFGPHHRFGLVVYNNIVVRWRDDMVSASPDNIRAATDYVDGVYPVGKTNVFEALEAAFAIQGFDAGDRDFLDGVDTMFLLTDGTPSEGRHLETEAILRRVRAWNTSRGVIIHTIGLGNDHNAGFLRQLARENGGQYVAPDTGSGG